MEDTELKNIWQSYNAQIEQSQILNLQSWALNLRTFEFMQHSKAEKMLGSLARFKTRAVVFGIIWTFFIGLLVFGDAFKHPYFTVSLGIIFLFNIATDIIYMRDIVLIKSLDFTGSLVDTQTRLSKLESSALGLRFLWLQTPFYATWFWNSSWIHYDSLQFWLIIFPITFGLCFASFYIYKNATAENLHKKWVRALLMTGPEYRSIVKARAFLSEIESFKQDLMTDPVQASLATGSRQNH